MFLKRKWDKISLLPHIQPYKLDLVTGLEKRKKTLQRSLTYP